jgi:hypothetical protein
MTAQASIKDVLIAQGQAADEVYRALCGFTARDPMAVVVACDFMLQRMQDRLPAPQMLAAAPYWSSARDEARLWAEVASDAQVIGMLVACIDRLDGASAAQKDRDALMVALWRAMPEARRKAFLASVTAPDSKQEGGP